MTYTMKSLVLFSALLLSSLSVTVGQEDDTLTPEKCFQGFGALQFRFDAYDRYGEFFKDDSALINWQAGTYTGAESIEEYARFLSPTNPSVDVADGAHQPGLRGIVNGTCEILLLTNSWYTFNSNGARAGSYNVTLMSLINYDPAENYIKSLALNLPEKWMEPLFGTTLGTDRTHQMVCTVMKDSCPEVWSANQDFLATAVTTQTARVAGGDDEAMGACISHLASLPAVTDEVYIDGNSHGCRAFHAYYASVNNVHCPHVSFIPMEDEDGKIKCQNSEGVLQTDYFTEDDIAKFDAFMQENSDRVNYPDGYKILDMEEMDDEEVAEATPDDSSGAGEVGVTFTVLSTGFLLGLF